MNAVCATSVIEVSEMSNEELTSEDAVLIKEAVKSEQKEYFKQLDILNETAKTSMKGVDNNNLELARSVTLVLIAKHDALLKKLEVEEE